MKKKYFGVTVFLLTLCLCFASLPGLAVKADSRTEDLKDKAKKKEEEKPKYVIKASDDEVYLMAACVMMESGGYSRPWIRRSRRLPIKRTSWKKS